MKISPYPAAFLLLSGLALAASAPAFDKLDTNKDGVLSPQEAAAGLKLDFKAADTNKDGVLDQAEYAQATRKQNAG